MIAPRLTTAGGEARATLGHNAGAPLSSQPKYVGATYPPFAEVTGAALAFPTTPNMTDTMTTAIDAAIRIALSVSSPLVSLWLLRRGRMAHRSPIASCIKMPPGRGVKSITFPGSG